MAKTTNAFAVQWPHRQRNGNHLKITSGCQLVEDEMFNINSINLIAVRSGARKEVQ